VAKLGIDARASRELQATILGLQGVQKDIQAEIRRFTRELLAPEWRNALLGHALTRQEVRLAESGRVKVSNQNVTLQAAGVGSSKTFDVKTLGRATEFGASPGKVSTYQRRSQTGRMSTVKRHVQTGFRLPRRNGYVVFPTAQQMIPRYASLWVQTVVRGLHEAVEGKK
jgi:hypothetical protein